MRDPSLFVPSHVGIWRARKFARLVARLVTDERVVFACLHSLWHDVAMQSHDGVLRGWDDFDLARASRWLGPADIWRAALIEEGWIDQTADGGLCVHEWAEYAGDWRERKEAKREHARARTKKWREGARDASPSVTNESGDASPSVTSPIGDASESVTSVTVTHREERRGEEIEKRLRREKSERRLRREDADAPPPDRPGSVLKTWQARSAGEIPSPVVEKTSEPEPEPERAAEREAEPQMAQGPLPAAFRVKRPVMGLGIIGQELRDRWPKSLAEVLAWPTPTASLAEIVGGGIVAGQTVEQGWRLRFPHLDGKGDRPTLVAALTGPVDHWLRTAERGGMPWTWPERALVEIGRWVQKDHDAAKRSHTQDASVKARGLEPVSDRESVLRYEQRKRDREAHAAARHHDPIGVPADLETWLRTRHSSPADTVPIGDVLAAVQLKVVR